MTKSTVTIKTEELYSLTGFLYESTAQNKDDILGTLIYLHGGGLVFGEKTDLPLEYLDILRSRFDVLLADYRLAPESNIDDIFSDLQDIYHFAASLKHVNIYVLGRSAGAYLSVMMARDFIIAGVIEFYGYFNFTHSDFDYLPHYQKHLSNLLIDDLEVTNTRYYMTVNDPVYIGGA